MREGHGAAACWALGAVVLVAACTGPAKTTTSASSTTAACSSQPNGFVSSPGLGPGSQLVFGRVSVQTGYSQAPVPVAGNPPWRYWQKRGILIRAGTTPVTVSVPPSWRRLVAITYGSYGIVSSLVLTTCRQPSGVWDAFAGGIYLRAAATCVPLVFAVGNQRTTARFGFAGRCT